MKQVQFAYESPEQFKDVLRRIARFRGERPFKLLFHVFTEQSDFGQLNDVCNTIVTIFPDALCVGGSCNGSVVSGKFSGKTVTISCTLFERETSRVGALQYDLNECPAENVADEIIRVVEKRPWIAGMEILYAAHDVSLSGFCDRLGSLRKEVKVFGGLAGRIGGDASAFVFSSRGGFSEDSVVCVLYGGDDLSVESIKVSGWKPLGRTFTVTKADGNVLWELDGRPAFEAYSKYLNIQNDYYFFNNTLEFPLLYRGHGENLLRFPLACSEEGALLLSSDIETGATARISYGDPQSIMESVKYGAMLLSNFCPNAIYVYSSIARKTFWGESDIDKEISPFNTLAPTSGSFALGEFSRTSGSVNFHNSTMVLAALREGRVDPSRLKTADVSDGTRAGKVSIISRLANFTNVSSAELMEMYNKMTKNSITDALTGLYNRGEIQRRIAERFAEYPDGRMSLVMIDIDNFKSVNDTFGHKEGDNVIVGLSNQIQMGTFECAPDADAGRWGGEEFMIMLPDMGINEAVTFAEAVRTGFAQVNFPVVGKKTISLGATELKKGDSIDAICVRVDEALYQAKRTGKNKVVVL